MNTNSKRIPLSIGCLILLMVAPATSWAQEPSWLFLSNNLDLLLISTSTVQNELKITSGQGELLEALGEDLRSQPGFSPPGRGPGPRRLAQDIPNSDRIIRVLLEQEQNKRLSEVRFQFQGPFAIDHEEFSKKIKLSEEQLEAVREARTKKRILRHSQLVELIGEDKANTWRKSLGKRLSFGREFAAYRSKYLELMQDKAKAERNRE